MDPFLIFRYFNQYKDKKFPMKIKNKIKTTICVYKTTCNIKNNILTPKQHAKWGEKKIIL